MHKNYGFCRIY